MSGFDSLLSTPITGPTYTDLAREVDQLKADNAVRLVAIRGAMAALSQPATFPADVQAAREFLAGACVDRPGAWFLDELERLKEQVATLIQGQQRNGEARQQAFLELAHELAEMEPAARDAAIRRVIDNAQ